jgi:hypothetical protein
MKREMIINSREFGLRIDVLSRLRTLPILLNSPDCWSDEVPAKLCNETALYVHHQFTYRGLTPTIGILAAECTLFAHSALQPIFIMLY